MPTKKEQTVERSQKTKPAAKKPSAKAAKAAKGALDLSSSSETGGSPIAETAGPEEIAAPAPAKAAAKKPVKRSSSKALGESISETSAPGPRASEHQEAHAPVHESQEHVPGHSVNEENISVRAYFIGEHRRAYGIPGNSQEDWLEAERQLQAEAIASLASGHGGLQH